MQRTDDITLKAPSGATLTERYHAHETVGKLLEQAVREFGREGQLDPSKPYILVLNATPLEDQLTLEAGPQRRGSLFRSGAVKWGRIPASLHPLP